MMWLFGLLLMLSCPVFGLGDTEIEKHHLGMNIKPEEIHSQLKSGNEQPVFGISNSIISKTGSFKSEDSTSTNFETPEGTFSEKSSLRFLASDSSIASIKPKDHSLSGTPKLGRLERQIMRDIEDRPLRITGEMVDISKCEHDCNNNGVCQQHFVKTLVSQNPDTFSYEPNYSCVCKANFKGDHCNICVKDFFGAK